MSGMLCRYSYNQPHLCPCQLVETTKTAQLREPQPLQYISLRSITSTVLHPFCPSWAPGSLSKRSCSCCRTLRSSSTLHVWDDRDHGTQNKCQDMVLECSGCISMSSAEGRTHRATFVQVGVQCKTFQNLESRHKHPKHAAGQTICSMTTTLLQQA